MKDYRMHATTVGGTLTGFFILLLSLVAFSVCPVRGELPPSGMRERCKKDTTKSCDPTRHVICNHWTGVLEDHFETGFPGTKWVTDGSEDYQWALTGCTRSDGLHSIWSNDPFIPCNGPCPHDVFCTTAEASVSIPSDTDVIRISFDYLWSDNWLPEDEMFMVFLGSSLEAW